MKLGKKSEYLVAVSADDAAGAAKMQDKVPQSVQVISDPELVLADTLGLRHPGGNPMTGDDIFRPAKLVVGADGNILKIEIRENYRVR